MPRNKTQCHSAQHKGSISRTHRAATLTLCVCLLWGCMCGNAFATSFVEAGKISWYGTTAHGKKTANGGIFNRNDFTAAHKILPFGSVIRVYMGAGGHRQTLVEVTDRGPFSKIRVLDVSSQAAHQLGLKRAGVASGVIEVVGGVSGRPFNSNNAYFIRLSDVLPAQKAHQLGYTLELRLRTVVRALYAAHSPNPGFILCIGPYETFPQARKAFLAVSQLCAAEDIIEAPRAGGDLPIHVPPPTSKSDIAKYQADKRSSVRQITPPPQKNDAKKSGKTSHKKRKKQK